MDADRGAAIARVLAAVAVLSLLSCAAPCVTIDVRGPAATLDDLVEWESRHGRVPDGAIVTFRGAREAAPDLAERVAEWRLWRGMRFEAARTARLIEFGWDIPDTAYLRQHVREMEKAPFDGVVLDPSIGREQRFSWYVFGAERLPEETLAGALADLKATRFERFAHNFLRFNASPGAVAWDETAAMLANVRLAARFVRETGLAGVLFDVESYQGKQWQGQAVDAARRVGREFGRVYAAEAPRTTILLTFGITHASHPEYRLLAPFIEGLIEGATTVEVVDGYENSYGFKDAQAFERARASIRASHPRIKAGFGLWMDFESGRRGWPANPFFSPDEFERAVRAACAASDGWVWIYTERANWWTGAGLPTEYRAALKQCRR